VKRLKNHPASGGGKKKLKWEQNLHLSHGKLGTRLRLCGIARFSTWKNSKEQKNTTVDSFMTGGELGTRKEWTITGQKKDSLVWQYP